VGLLAASCGEPNAGLTPPEPSFAPGGKPSSCLDDAANAAGSVFAGTYKNTFSDLLDANNSDGKISEGDAFQAAIRISIAFDSKEAEFWSAYDAALGDWASSLSKKASPASAATLTRLIFQCANDDPDGDDPFPSQSAGFDWDAFETDIEMALTQTGLDTQDYSDFGAFAVRNELDYGAVTSPDIAKPSGFTEPYWGVEPQAGEQWSHVFGLQQVLIYGFADDAIISPGQAALLGGSFSWNVLPRFARFQNDVLVGTCQVEPTGPSQGQANTERVIREGNVTTEATPSFCTDGFRAEADASLLSLFATAVGRMFRPAELHAGSTLNPGGKGGLAINWSTFDIALIGQVQLVFVNQPCKDQLETTDTANPNFLDFEPCDDPDPPHVLNVRAETVTGLPIEEICVFLGAVDNNGVGKSLVGTEGDPLCPQVGTEATARTVDDGSGNAGHATFDPMYVVGRGGFRLRASADGFPDADSDGFNVRPVN
jgi:hypothetical protein